jgi:hypothetical protein
MHGHDVHGTLDPVHDLDVSLLLCNLGLCCWACMTCFFRLRCWACMTCFFRSTVPIGLTCGSWMLHTAVLCTLDLAMGMIGLLQLVKLRESGLRHWQGGCVQPWWKDWIGTGPRAGTGPCACRTRFAHGLVTDLQWGQPNKQTNLVTGPAVA